METDDRFDWTKNTRGFTTDGSQPAHLLLRQMGDDDFELGGPFLFTHPVTGKEIPVSADLLGRTDLASVPAFLGWFARRHGRHTFAALMHDELITATPELLPARLRLPRAEADLYFRDALVDSQVPLVKAWIMWAGVTAGTRWSMKPWGAAGIAAWVLAAVTGTIVLVTGVLTGAWASSTRGSTGPTVSQSMRAMLASSRASRFHGATSQCPMIEARCLACGRTTAATCIRWRRMPADCLVQPA